MLESIANQPNLAAARVWLDATAMRQQALAANLANASTPGYKRVDLNSDFEANFRRELQSGQLGNGQNFPLSVETDTSARAVGPDGNNVAIEEEMQAINENALRYQFMTQYVSTSLKHLETAITGRVQPS
ncbi:MAG: flagellar basal body rod protein FlgB [Verrucomicrobiota bacterium JB022]|nr:flagellar basal body rod protein FlgB [Verrucomicrobiota bacterium JB022]